MYHQEPPFSIQIGLVRGCNIACSYCAVSAFKKAGVMKGYEFMTVETMERIASEIARVGWNARIELAMHGEPTMHPELELMLSTLRKHLPKNQIMLLTNGARLLPDPHAKLEAMFEAGLDVLGLDNYEHVPLMSKVLGKLGDDAAGIAPVLHYPADKLDRMSNVHANLGRKRRIVIIKDPSVAVDGNHSHLNSHAGAVNNGGLPQNFIDKRCNKVFREMVFYHTGVVNACCNDWEGRLVVGNIHDGTIEECWNNPVFDAIRHSLYRSRKHLMPCRSCDMAPNRPGLLPDKLGKDDLPGLQSEQVKILMDLYKAEPLYPLPKGNH